MSTSRSGSVQVLGSVEDVDTSRAGEVKINFAGDGRDGQEEDGTGSRIFSLYLPLLAILVAAIAAYGYART